MGLVFHAKVIQLAPVEVVNKLPVELFMCVINMYCGVRLVVITLRLIINPFGFLLAQYL